jgi:hypothetical protein
MQSTCHGGKEILMELQPMKSAQPYRSGFLRLFWVRCVLDFRKCTGPPQKQT